MATKHNEKLSLKKGIEVKENLLSQRKILGWQKHIPQEESSCNNLFIILLWRSYEQVTWLLSRIFVTLDGNF